VPRCCCCCQGFRTFSPIIVPLGYDNLNVKHMMLMILSIIIIISSSSSVGYCCRVTVRVTIRNTVSLGLIIFRLFFALPTWGVLYLLVEIVWLMLCQSAHRGGGFCRDITLHELSIKFGSSLWLTLTADQLTAFDIDDLIDKSDCKLFRQTTQPGHCLHHLLPSKTSTYSSYQLRKRQHPYLLPSVQYSQFKNSYINRCLFKYT